MTFRERYERNRIRDREMWFLRFVLGWPIGKIAAEFELSAPYVRARIVRSASQGMVRQRHIAPDPIPDWWRRLAAAGAIPGGFTNSTQRSRIDCYRQMDELAQPPRLDPLLKMKG